MSSEIINTTVEEYKKLVESLHSENYEMMVDLTVVDWFRKKEPRFEVVVQFLSISKNQRKTIKVFVDDEDLSIPSITDIYPSANFYEREAFDMFGINFLEHPDLTRILTDYGFKGHPLRKDFPLTGFNEVRYSEKEKKVIYEPVKLEQNYRNFDFESPWEGTNYIKEIKNSEKDGKKN